MTTNFATGEVDETPAASVELVPLNIAGLDEDALREMFPTPGQCVAALLIARERIARAPAVLAEMSKAVKAAKRQLIVARGYARQQAEGRDAETRKLVAESHADVIQAWEAIDDAELALEYARELRKSLSEDVEILRSLNANFRGEHS